MEKDYRTLESHSGSSREGVPLNTLNYKRITLSNINNKKIKIKTELITKPHWHSDRDQLYSAQKRFSSSTAECNEEKQPKK